tara:strand:- start:2 stop:511 length:510 start_codon:yes stop_codon:yes gene_type:complete
MPTVSPVNIKKQLSGTWKISENLGKEAIFEISESSDSEMDELDYDAFELQIQGKVEYNQSGKILYKFFMQIFVSSDDVNLRLRYYIQQEGNWSYHESNAEISESFTEVDVLCLDDETEEVTKENPDILEEFVPKKMNDSSFIESISENELMLRDKETGLMMRLTRACES